MNEAIKQLAIKGGYGQGTEPYSTMESGMILDPLFWQALGKALGWNDNIENIQRCEFCKMKNCHRKILNGKPALNTEPNNYLNHAHEYFELILTGGDTEKFWQSLLSGSATSDRPLTK